MFKNACELPFEAASSDVRKGLGQGRDQDWQLPTYSVYTGLHN
jgi:hypothetical protein